MEITVSENRESPRIEAKLKISCEGKNGFFETFMGNISQEGIFLETPKALGKIGDKIDLVIGFPNSKETIGVVGRIARIIGPNQIGKAKGIAIDFLKIEAKRTFLFNRFLEELLNARGMGCRKAPRIDARITVEFSNPLEMGKCLSNNLSRSGIFIQTKADFNLGQTVSLVLIHPQTLQKLELEGEIVHIRKSLASSPNPDFADGVGIKFTNLNKLNEDRISYFLRNLLIQKKKGTRKKKTPKDN